MSWPSMYRLPGGGSLETGQHAQQRGLARARATQQTENLAALHVQRNVVYGDEVTEPLGDLLDAQIRASGHGLLASSVLKRVQVRVNNRV